MEALQDARGKGRNDYAISVLWFCAMLQPLLRHTTMEQTLAELRHNADLRKLGGMEHAEQVPNSWNMSRFLGVLGEEPFRTLLQQLFDRLLRRLGQAVPNLGRHTSGDATHLSARQRRGAREVGLLQPDGGHKEYTDETGRVSFIFPATFPPAPSVCHPAAPLTMFVIQLNPAFPIIQLNTRH